MSDLSEAQTRLSAIKTAYDKALLGEQVRFGDMFITRQNIKILRDEMLLWQGIVNVMTAKEAGALNPGVLTPRWT